MLSVHFKKLENEKSLFYTISNTQVITLYNTPLLLQNETE